MTTTMESLRALVAKKDAMEKEMQETLQYLENLGVGMTNSLVDNEGFPRSDVDLYAVRNARQRVSCLQNDLRSMMRGIEHQLHVLHSSGNDEDGACGQTSSNGHNANENGNKDEDEEEDEDMDTGNAAIPAPHRSTNIPFLRVDDIAPGSPAASAGLNNGDLLLQFGSLCRNNFTEMRQLSDIVQNSVERPIRLSVLRDGHAVRLSITPKRWSGPGLLGCRALVHNV